MNKISCSIPILTLNSKTTLERILPTLIEQFEDVFIVDGNSTDGTQDYARSLGVRVERQFDTDEPNQRITNFCETRSMSWTLCKTDWLFVLDADEVPTEELVRLIRTIVAENDSHTVHCVKRHLRLPDGRIIRNSPFYSAYFVRLFSLHSGVTLMDRKVHERFMIPEGLRTVNHEEAIICPEPSPAFLRQRARRYLELQFSAISDARVWYLWKWIIWYNARSFLGQLLRAVKAQVRSISSREPTLPWSYSVVFLEYPIRAIGMGARAWMRARFHRVPKTGA